MSHYPGFFLQDFWLTGMLLRMQVVWDMTLFYSVSDSQLLEVDSTFVFMGQAVHTE